MKEDLRRTTKPAAAGPDSIVPLLPLEPLRRALEPDLPEARTLPSRAYTSPDVLAWETTHFFERSWVCLGRAGDLVQPGHQRAVAVGREGVLLVRGEDGRLRGFHNVCRHRGHELLERGEARNSRVVKCPYHAWVYGLDGRLAAAPRFGDMPGFAREEYPLVEARVREWHGWVFVNGSGDAPPLEEHVGNLDDLVRLWRLDRMFVAARHEYTVRANWKTITENYHECYHCPNIHPELCKVTPPDSGQNVENTGAWVGGYMELRDFARTMSITGESLGVVVPGLPPEEHRRVYYCGLVPNLLISLHPDYVLTHRLEPVAPDRTRVECEWLFPSEARDREGFDPGYAVEFWDITNREDWRAVESVARGLSSRGARPGPFAWSEDEVHLFMAMIARGYIEGRLDPGIATG